MPQSTTHVAIISIVLFSLLSVTCFYYARKFWNSRIRAVITAKYGVPKFVFFVVLGCSAIFELPLFIACLQKNSPNQCEWDDPSFAVVHCFHLVATVGYQFSIITPAILWSDIIQHKDGNFCNTTSSLDAIKIFFRISFFLYCCVVLGIVIGTATQGPPETIAIVSYGLMPAMLFVTAAGCLFCGLRLQYYVMKVRLNTAIQLKFLVQLNFVMLLITCSYFLRALLVMSLFDQMTHSYKVTFDGISKAYYLWILLTQWLPYVLCSFCLVYTMRFKGGGNGTLLGHSSVGRTGTGSGGGGKVGSECNENDIELQWTVDQAAQSGLPTVELLEARASTVERESFALGSGSVGGGPAGTGSGFYRQSRSLSIAGLSYNNNSFSGNTVRQISSSVHDSSISLMLRLTENPLINPMHFDPSRLTGTFGHSETGQENSFGGGGGGGFGRESELYGGGFDAMDLFRSSRESTVSVANAGVDNFFSVSALQVQPQSQPE
jgi:hypothetical protein